jgi:hypothetical protein
MRALRSVAASTMIADLKSERKVRCHKWAVENLPAQIATCIRTRLFKNGDRPVSPRGFVVPHFEALLTILGENVVQCW